MNPLRPQSYISYSENIAIFRKVAYSQPMTDVEANELFDCCSPLLLCCGVWTAITTLPHVCPYCGEHYLQEQP